MANRNITVGIDVGTYATRVVVAEWLKDSDIPRIIGTGYADSHGMRHGYIVESANVVKSIKKAVLEAERAAGVPIKRALVSIGGVSLSSEISHGEAIISKANNEVTSLDIAKAISQSEESITTSNRKIIHVSPIAFKLDGKEVMGRPETMQGIKLEVKTLVVSCLAQHLDDMVTTVTLAGIEVVDVIPSPIAASEIALSSKQRSVGAMLVNIGAETVSIAVWENTFLIGLHVFSIGSTDITNDIALGFRIPLEEAEGIKTGTFLSNYPKKKLDEIIEARLSDIFELIENYLKKIKRSGLLPAGIIITGGGSSIAVIEELSKALLRLPSKIGSTEIFSASKHKVRDSAWFVASGLCLLAKEHASNPGRNGPGFIAETKRSLQNIFRQFLP